MVSHGPDIQNYNFTHMYNFNDYRNLGDNKICNNKNSIFGYIYNSPNTLKFKKIIEKANLIGQLNEIQANFTIFVVEDKYLEHFPNSFFDDMDIGLAKDIINCSLLNRKINKDILISSPISYYSTKNSQIKILVTNISNKTKLNNSIEVIKFDLNLDNGLIHFVDNLILPNLDISY